MPYITSRERIGLQKGLQQGLLSGIKAILEVKFGSDGLTILPEIAQIENVDVLEAILTSLKTVNTIEELRQVYQQ